MLGKKAQFDNKRLLKTLNVEQVPIKTTVIDMAHSLIERGFIQKK